MRWPLLLTAAILLAVVGYTGQIIKQMGENSQKDQNVSEFNKFLQNNNDFLQEKYEEYFKKPSINTKDLNRQAAVRYIYDVFSFSKYEEDEKMNNTLQRSLLKNVEDFVATLTKRKLTFNNKTAVELLKFCIENNEMFAVKYDKKDKKIKTEEHKNQSTFTEKEQSGPTNYEKQVKQEEGEHEEEQKEKEEESEQKQDKSEAENKSQNIQQDPNHANQFDETNKQSLQKVTDPELVKKNLKQMFEFYCKQQQNVGAHTTFDRISYECKTMTLGKFLAFATSTQIINDKIDKNLLMRKFKLLAEGKKQIQFEIFYEIVQTLASIDEGLIPKLGVDEKIYFKNKLKERFMPFNTKDQSSREIKRDHIFIPKLTQHSGKLSDALHDEIKLRKQLKMAGISTGHSKVAQHDPITKTPITSQRYQSGLRQQPAKDVSQIIASPNQLVNSNIRDFEEDLGFLEKMINTEQTDEEWLKDYKIPHKKASIALPPRLMSRKESIVPNLKKRVEELERTQTRQTVHLEKRQFLSNNRQRDRNSKSVLT